jgi:hypothetical protein
MKKLLIGLSLFSLVSCSNQKYIYTINYSKTVEDYTVVSVESVVLSKPDSAKAINKLKQSPNYKIYAPTSDSVWVEEWIRETKKTHK